MSVFDALRVRPVTPDHPGDVDAAAVLFGQYRQFYGQAPDAGAARAFLHDRLARGESVVLVAQLSQPAQDSSAGAMVGLCQLYPSFCSVEAAPIHILYDLYVRPESRGQGVGRLLLQAAVRRAQADGKVRIDLTTARTNAAAQALYSSEGWARDDVFLAYSRRVGA